MRKGRNLRRMWGMRARRSSTSTCQELPECALRGLGLLLPVEVAAVCDADLAAHCANIAQRGWRGTDGGHHWRCATVLLLLRGGILVPAVRVICCVRVGM